MAYSTNQVKLGPELISNSREAWLGYYAFMALGLGILAGGAWAVGRSGATGTDYALLMMGVATLALVSFGIGVMCHLLGHIIDTLEDSRSIEMGQKAN